MKLLLALPLLLFVACDGSDPTFAGLQLRTTRITWPLPNGVVNDARPIIRWERVQGATRHRVTLSLFDSAGRVLESHETAAAQWIPVQPLPDGEVLRLTVEALTLTGAPLSSETVTFKRIALPGWLEGTVSLTAYDPLFTQGGYRLFNLIPRAGQSIPAFVLVDQAGQVVWWYRHFEGDSIQDVRVLDNTNLVFLVRGARDAQNRIPWSNANEITWDGAVVWTSRPEIMAHHEIGPGPVAGSRMYLKWIYEDIGGETIEGDGIEIVDPQTNQVLWEWRNFDHFDFANWLNPGLDITFTGWGKDWSHSNAVVWDPARSLIWVSSRHFDAVFAIDYPSGDVKIILGRNGLGGEGLTRHQHAPEIQADGSILLWDNGNGRDPQVSRVAHIAFDQGAGTAEVIWEWTDDGLFDFAVGDADRLPNGNVLATAGVSGRIIELNLAGDIVWELRTDPSRWWYYRAEYLPKEMVPAWVRPFG